MFCTRCGSELRVTDRYCCQCGTNIASPYGPQAGPPSAAYPFARLIHGKKIAGVCAGFARYFDCDVTLMRVIWLILAFGTGLGFIGYIVAWIVMPVERAVPVTDVATVSPGGLSING